MEVLLRCELRDVPGMLATLAGAIGEASGDIQAVEVVEADRAKGLVIDDLWVVTEQISGITDHIERLQGARLIHAGLSRGLPADAVSRLAMGIDALMSGAMPADDGFATLIGGLLGAKTAEIVPPGKAPNRKNRRELALPISSGVLVLTREYKFLDTEVQRATSVLAVCERATAIAAGT